VDPVATHSLPGNPARRRWLGRLRDGLGLLGLIRFASLWPSLGAAAWPEASFHAEKLEAALATLGPGPLTEDPTLGIVAPELAENGAVVPVRIDTERRPQSISILVAGNPVPMVARFEFAPGVRGHLSTRIKMGQSSDITVVVADAEGLHVNRRQVEVTVGGCG
jgi:sulfur-oxidizing protein SoxY